MAREAGCPAWWEQLTPGGRYRIDWCGFDPPVIFTLTVRHRELDPLLGPRVYAASDDGIAVWLDDHDMQGAEITSLPLLTN